MKAKVENCRVTRLLSHWGQRTRVRLGVSKLLLPELPHLIWVASR